jgi:hypothetical protein
MTSQEQELEKGVKQAFGNVEVAFETVDLGNNIRYEMLRFTVAGKGNFAVPRFQVANAPSIPNLVEHVKSEINIGNKNRK